MSELAEMREAIDAMVGSLYPPAAVRGVVDDGVTVDRAAWRRMGTEFDLLGLHAPVELGGQGQSPVYTALVVNALGRRLAPTPQLAVLGAALPLLAYGGSPQQRERFLTPMLAGDAIVTVAGLEAGLDGPDTTVTVTWGNGMPLLAGRIELVAHGPEADHVVIAAGDPAAAFIVESSAPGVTWHRQETLDLTRPRYVLDLADVVAEPLPQVTADVLERAAVESTILLAVESAAAARTCLESAVAYAGIRTQFDRPIGAFQALQHALADLYGDVETAAAAADAAVEAWSSWTRGPVPASLLTLTRIAKVSAAEVFSRAARDGIHLHGGIGFTWEHDAHLYYRRALTDRTALGSPTAHRRALAATLLTTVGSTEELRNS